MSEIRNEDARLRAEHSEAVLESEQSEAALATFEAVEGSRHTVKESREESLLTHERAEEEENNRAHRLEQLELEESAKVRDLKQEAAENRLALWSSL